MSPIDFCLCGLLSVFFLYIHLRCILPDITVPSSLMSRHGKEQVAFIVLDINWLGVRRLTMYNLLEFSMVLEIDVPCVVM